MNKIKTIYFSIITSCFLSLPVWAQNYSTNTLKSDAINKLSKINSIENLMSRGINAMVMFMGSIALALVIYAGFLWMTASGNESKIEKAKTIIVWTMLGTVAIGASYGVITFVINIFG